MGLKILHANANILMANGLASLLNKGGGVEKVELCMNENELYNKLDSDQYDLVIIDPLATGFFSYETAIDLKKRYPQQKVIVITDNGQLTEVLRVLAKGIQGYLTRQCDEGEILQSIFSVAKGEKFYCNKVLDIILQKDINGEEYNCDPTTLTERENEVTALIASGMTNKEIAEKLFLSPHTVHTHRKNIIKKLGVKSVSELTVYALNVGLIEN